MLTAAVIIFIALGAWATYKLGSWQERFEKAKEQRDHEWFLEVQKRLEKQLLINENKRKNEQIYSKA